MKNMFNKLKETIKNMINNYKKLIIAIAIFNVVYTATSILLLYPLDYLNKKIFIIKDIEFWGIIIPIIYRLGYFILLYFIIKQYFKNIFKNWKIMLILIYSLIILLILLILSKLLSPLLSNFYDLKLDINSWVMMYAIINFIFILIICLCIIISFIFNKIIEFFIKLKNIYNHHKLSIEKKQKNDNFIMINYNMIASVISSATIILFSFLFNYNKLDLKSFKLYTLMSDGGILLMYITYIVISISCHIKLQQHENSSIEKGQSSVFLVVQIITSILILLFCYNLIPFSPHLDYLIRLMLILNITFNTLLLILKLNIFKKFEFIIIAVAISFAIYMYISYEFTMLIGDEIKIKEYNLNLLKDFISTIFLGSIVSIFFNLNKNNINHTKPKKMSGNSIRPSRKR